MKKKKIKEILVDDFSFLFLKIKVFNKFCKNLNKVKQVIFVEGDGGARGSLLI